MAQPDILLFMSDQHSSLYSGWYGGNVDTPNLDALCENGTRFDQAYTACPLCVPARMAMLSGQRASQTGIFTNLDTLPSTMPTFLHRLATQGYETVLAGRMHFVGPDQRHGFTRRIAPDFTNSSIARPSYLVEDFGVHTQTMGYKWCTHVVGGGQSPVLCYDEMVLQALQNYLGQPHEKPQFIVVGTYGPHFPYVAPPQLFTKYRNRFADISVDYAQTQPLNATMENLREPDFKPDLALACRAAYAGMIEQMDTQIGQVFHAWKAFSNARGTKQLFGYLSDHGDTVGQHGIFGKKTFFEGSAKIPMIFTGDGVAKGKIVTSLVSLLDLGATVCEWADIEPLPNTDSVSLAPILRGEINAVHDWVFSEVMDKAKDGNWSYGMMLRQDEYKYICYQDSSMQEFLFDLKTDPNEIENLASQYPQRMQAFRMKMQQLVNARKQQEKQAQRETQIAQIAAFERTTGCEDRERFRAYPPRAKQPPDICVAGLTTPPGYAQQTVFYGLPNQKE